MSEPRNNSDTTNQAREDAQAGRKADTRLWPDEARTYDDVHSTSGRAVAGSFPVASSLRMCRAAPANGGIRAQ